MKNISIQSLIEPIIEVFHKYHVTIFIVVVVGGLAGAVIVLNNILQSSTDISGYTATTTTTSFDQATIDRIKELHTSDNTASVVIPSGGRISPFSE
jgi:predicted class III extradiol MEMO1 family dioxygenase